MGADGSAPDPPSNLRSQLTIRPYIHGGTRQSSSAKRSWPVGQSLGPGFSLRPPLDCSESKWRSLLRRRVFQQLQVLSSYCPTAHSLRDGMLPVSSMTD